MASAASLIELFKMPIREIEDKFTISEIVITAWRSQEQSYIMKHPSPTPTPSPETNRPQHRSNSEQISSELISSLPDRFFNEEGELDMRLMSSEEAIRFMNAAGFPVTPMFK